ncbi:MAG: ribonuclease E/G [Lachnospiraceae bacterium]|nr:ribonuclease E/G [Lachnospiraceae bacterium]
MNENTIVLTKYNNAILFMSTDGKRPLEYQFFNEGEDNIGDIFLCEIKEKQQGIDACFVNYGHGRRGFLNSTKYNTGDLVPLQLKKAGSKDKDPVFSDDLTLSGMYVILTNANRNLAMSKKLNPEKRSELKRRYGSFLSDLEYGITLRTNCQNASLGEVLSEADKLAGVMDDILGSKDTRTCGSVLHKTDNKWVKHCFNADVSGLKKIITDDKEIYDVLNSSVIKFLGQINPAIKIELYSDSLLPLDKLYSINTGMEDAQNKKVWLKSGGFLYIERTEALHTIDVNTGSMNVNKNKEEAILKCNLEATDEICRQIRLRNLSGIILIDYINMQEAAGLKQVTDRLKSLIAMDTVKTSFHDVTALNLVEITRQRIREPLEDQIKHNSKQ